MRAAGTDASGIAPSPPPSERGTRAETEAGAWPLERRYRRLLLAYPRDYRSRFGDELVATLLETSRPRQALPAVTESAALVLGGLRTRATCAAQGSSWRDGLHLGVLVVAVANLALLIPYAGSIPLWVALSAGLVLSVMRGWVRLALPLVVLVGGKAAAIALGRPWLDRTLLPVFPDEIWGGNALYGFGGPIAPIAAYVAVFLGLLVLAARDQPLRKRSWRWWTVAPLMAGADPAWLDVAEGSPRAIIRIGLEAALLLLTVWAGHVAGDPRWAAAAGVYLLTQLAVLAENFSLYSRQDLAHWALLSFLTAAATAVPFRSRTQLQL